jgi:maltose-binding protein MalE
MKRKLKARRVFSAKALATTSIVAASCANIRFVQADEKTDASRTTQFPQSFRKPTIKPLVIWFTVEGAKGMRKVAEAFTRDTGVPVVVETTDEGPAKFQQAASAGKGPDIYIYAHDRIGEWVAGGLVRAVQPS